MSRSEILQYRKNDGTLYLSLNPELKVIKNEDVADGVAVDLAFGNEIVGIEILGVEDWPAKVKEALLKYFEGSSIHDN